TPRPTQRRPPRGTRWAHSFSAGSNPSTKERILAAISDIGSPPPFPHRNPRHEERRGLPRSPPEETLRPRSESLPRFPTSDRAPLRSARTPETPRPPPVWVETRTKRGARAAWQ